MAQHTKNRFSDLDPDFLIPPLGPTFLSKPKRPGFFQTLGQELGQGFGKLGRGLKAVALPPELPSDKPLTERLQPFIDLPLGALQVAGALPVAIGEKLGEFAERGAFKTGIQTPDEAQRVGQAVSLGSQFAIPQRAVTAVPKFLGTLGMIRTVKKAGGARGVVPMILRSKQVRPLPEFEDIRQFGDFFKQSALQAGERVRKRSGNLIESGLRRIPGDETRSAKPLLKSIDDALEMVGARQPGARVFTTLIERKIGKLGPALEEGLAPAVPRFGFRRGTRASEAEQFGELVPKDIPTRFRSGTLIEGRPPGLPSGQQVPDAFATRAGRTQQAAGVQGPPQTAEEVIIELGKEIEGAGELTARNIDFLRTRINSLLRDADKRGIRVDKAAVSRIRGGVERTLEQFSDKFPREVRRIKQGVQMFREKFVPFFERGTLLDDIIRKRPASKVIDRLMAQPVESLEDVAKAIKNRKTLDILSDAILERFKQNADDLATGEFGLAKYLRNFSGENLLKIKALMSPDRFKELNRVLPVLRQAENRAQQLLTKRSPFLFRAGIVQIVRGAATLSFTRIAGGVNIIVAPRQAAALMSNIIGVRLMSQAILTNPKSEKALTLALRIANFGRTAQRQQEQGQSPLLPEQIEESFTSQFLPPGTEAAKNLIKKVPRFFE